MVAVAFLLVTFSLLPADGDESDSDFSKEGFLDDLGEVEGTDVNYFEENVEVDGGEKNTLDYDIDSDTGEVKISSESDAKYGKVTIEGNEYDLSEGGEIILNKGGGIESAKSISIDNQFSGNNLYVGEGQEIKNLDENAKISFSKKEGTLSYEGKEGDSLKMEGVNFEKDMELDVVNGLSNADFDFSVGESGGTISVNQGKFTLPEGEYSVEKGEWNFGDSEAIIEKIPSSGVSMFKGENVQLSEEITGREGLSFSGSLKPETGGRGFIIPEGTRETKLNNGVSFFSDSGAKGKTSLYFKEEDYNGEGSSLFIGENTIKGSTKSSPGKAATVILEEENDYYGDLMDSSEEGKEKWLAIGSESATGTGEFTLTGMREEDGEKYAPVLERSGDVSFENGNRRYEGVGNRVVEKRISNSVSKRNEQIGEREKTPTVIVTNRKETPSITSVITEGKTYHGYSSGIQIESHTIEYLETINPQEIPEIPFTADPSLPYEISVSDLSTEHENTYRTFENAVRFEENVQQTHKPKFEKMLEEKLGSNEAKNLINKMENADSNEERQEIADSYYKERGESLPSFEGSQEHDKNLLKLEKSLNSLKDKGSLSETDYEEITSLGINERELIDKIKEDESISWEEAYEKAFIEGERNIRIGPRVLHGKYDLGPSQWVRTD